MRKRGKQLISALLSVVLALSVFGGMTFTASADYSVGDTVEFGSYPQSKVTASELIDSLNAQATDWQSYGYYSGTGNGSDGQMTASDYMQYCDVTYGEQKYRGVQFAWYRPYNPGDAIDNNVYHTYQDDNGYAPNTVYWFQYEPLQWRVLDPSTGLVLCDTIIDSQSYNNFTMRVGVDEYGSTACWGDAGRTYYSNNYADSSLRQWLNDDFYNTAFTAAQQNRVFSTTLDNSAYDSSRSVYDSASTTDKVFLLSYGDVLNTSYGFEASTGSSSARRAQGSDYAKCQGLYVGSSGNQNTLWRLRSAADESGRAMRVDSDGSVEHDDHFFQSTAYTCVGIRPALTLNLQSVGDTPNDAYSVGDTVEFGSYPQSKVTDSDMIAALNEHATDWQSYGYYIGTGNGADGQMTASDYMLHCDVTYGEQKYRGVKLSQYRPYNTRSTSSANNSYQDDNGYAPNTVYWFLYEPLQWRVLDPSTGLVLSETIIDSQPYNSFIMRTADNDESWGDADQTYYANNYAESSLRHWLINDFYNTAFTAEQQDRIFSTTLDNSAFSASYSAYDSETTSDKVFMLSFSDMTNTAYGFDADNMANDPARQAHGSDYAKCQGLHVGLSSECSEWWLRSAGMYSFFACDVIAEGRFGDGFQNNVSYTDVGIRPALNMDLRETPTAESPEGLTATYGQTLADVTLSNPSENTPGTWSWDIPSTSVGCAGEHSFPATFTPTDTATYRSVQATLTVFVLTANPIANEPTGLTAEYGQMLEEIAIPNPAGNTNGTWSWNNPSTSIGEAGEYTFPATFTPTDTTNYNTVQTMLTVTVAQEPNDAFSVGDTLEFGNYPQRKVTDSDLIAALNGQTVDWQSYGYYSGTGEINDGWMTASDYMQYCDVTYGAQKYRGVQFSWYRPYYTGYAIDNNADHTYQDENGYTPNTVYWFQYEPLQWRVLDPSTGLVLCETIIDSQPYNNFIMKVGEDEYGAAAAPRYGDADLTYYANNYAASSLRQWLNDDFYSTAFTTAQQNRVFSTTLNNSAYDSSHSAYDSETTTDKVFLLSYGEALNASYGFESSTGDSSARQAQGSDYAKCQGLNVDSSNQFSFWRLRSAADESYTTMRVGSDGEVNNNNFQVTFASHIGIRPALRMVLRETPTAQAPTNLTAMYGQRLADIAISNPSGNTSGTWTWDDPTTFVGDLGMHTFPATFTPNDASRYFDATVDLTVTVVPNDKQFVSIDDQIALTLLLDLDARGKTVNDVTITFGGETYACTGTEMTGGDYDGLYKFKIVMAPAQYAQEIVVTIPGDEEPLTTSVKYYCEQLSGEAYNDYAEAQNLAKAILAYGQAASNRFNGTTDEIPNLTADDVTAAQSATAVFSDGTGKVAGASFMALTKPEFRFYTSSITEAQAVAYNQAGVTATMDGSKPDQLTGRFVKKADGSILLEVTGVSAENMDKTITVAIPDLGTITFNGNAFARAMANSGNTTQQNLGAALYNYGAAAKTCFGA